MRSSYKLLFFLTVAIIGFTACQKEFTIEDDLNPVDPSPTTNDSIYLDKIYGLADLGSGLDTVVIITVGYDDRKRVIFLTDSTTDVADESYIHTYQYFYTGIDTLPVRSFSSWVDLTAPGDYDSTTAFFFYDASGRKVKDSILNKQNTGSTESSSLDLANYSFGTNKMYSESISESILPFPFMDTRRDTATLNAAGDIVSNKSYQLNGTVFDLVETMSLTYDTKISPFKYLSLYMAHFSAPYQVLEIFEHMSKANILNESSVLPPFGVSFTRQSTYQYNTLQLPVKSTTIIDQGTVNEHSFQFIFTYKRL